MHLVWSLVLLGLYASAIPHDVNTGAEIDILPKSAEVSETPPPKDVLNFKDHFEACEASINCEVVRDSQKGKRKAQFIKGMEPGTEIFDYISLLAGQPEYTSHLSKRVAPKKTYEELQEALEILGKEVPENRYVQNFTKLFGNITGYIDNHYPRAQTHLAFSDSKTEFGCGPNINITEMMGHMNDLCREGSCIEVDSYKTTINWTTPDENGIADPPKTEEWVLKANGNFPPSLQNDLVLAIQAAALKAQRNWTQNTYQAPGYGESSSTNSPSGSCHMVIGSHEYNVLRTALLADGKTVATQAIMVAMPHVNVPASVGFCHDIFWSIGAQTIIGSISDMDPLIPAVFGVITTICLAITETTGS